MLGYLHSLKLCSHKIVTSYKGKKVLTLQQGPDSHHLKQVSKKKKKKKNHQQWDKLTSHTLH